jgi:hypothetical protein
MKLPTSIPLAAVLAVLAVALAGCAGNPETALRQRAQAYTQSLADEKYDDAVNYVDPDVVAKRGRTGLTTSFKLVVGVVKGLSLSNGRKLAGFEIRKVDFDAGKARANLQVVFFTTDAKDADRKEQPFDQKWVLKNRTWFATE